jgi:hypothetical protein
VAKNEGGKVAESLYKTLDGLRHTNVIVVNIPHRHDLSPSSCVNDEVERVNTKIRKTCNHFNNVRVLEVDKCPRTEHTKHGLHFNGYGKGKLCDNILGIIACNFQLKAPHPLVVDIPGNKQVNAVPEISKEASRAVIYNAIQSTPVYSQSGSNDELKINSNKENVNRRSVRKRNPPNSLKDSFLW